jgi:hypothetical protein
VISEQLFEAYLNCKTKAQLIFSQATGAKPSHAIHDWQRRIAETYQAKCRDLLQAADGEDWFVGTPPSEDLRSGKYRLIVQPHITAQGVESYIHAHCCPKQTQG